MISIGRSDIVYGFKLGVNSSDIKGGVPLHSFIISPEVEGSDQVMRPSVDLAF
jgi:hypothetical protein